MKKQKVMNLLKILKTIKDYYQKGYFVYEFDKLLNNENPTNLIPVDNNTWKINKSFMINPLYEPKEALVDGKIYIETVLYLFALWAYRYFTEEKYEYDLSKVKFPGLFQFFQHLFIDDFRERTSDFDELSLYLTIALDYFSEKYFKKDENDFFYVEAITTVGMSRYENQDSFDFYIKDDFLLGIVADGMGGGSCGDIASKIAVNSFMQKKDKLVAISTKELNNFLLDTTLDANQKIINYKNNHKLKSMGTTLSAVIIKDEKLFFTHVGDSRIYVKLKNSDKFEQITLDHSVAEMEFRKGNITLEEKNNFAKNILSYVLGSDKLKKDDINITSDYKNTLLVKDIDEILICCDGFWDVVPSEMFSMDVKELLKIANQNITNDNTTIIKIKIKDTNSNPKVTNINEKIDILNNKILLSNKEDKNKIIINSINTIQDKSKLNSQP